MGGPSQPEAPDVMGAAREQAEFDRLAADTETWANRPSQYGPTGSTTWDTQMVDSRTGRPIEQNVSTGKWYFSGREDLEGYVERPEIYNDDYTTNNENYYDYVNRHREDYDDLDNWNAYRDYERSQWDVNNGIEAVTDWTQNTQLNPEWQESLDAGRGLLNNQIDYRVGEQDRWRNEGPVNFGGAVGGFGG